MAPGTVFNLSNNTTELMIADTNGNALGCTGLTSYGVTVNYSNDNFITAGGASNGCP
jgi:hypothetical protein